ncbi:MAG TPA: DUF3467 domain-containing protein [Candidatus Deferrimicrobium sp.]
MGAPQKPMEIQVTFPEHLKGGAYSNSMTVTHTREEFVLDFMMVAPPAGSVTARIILSPGHAKRVVAALADNVRKYEGAHGTIFTAEEPTGTIGFN